ncbi:MAG: D-alanine--D-alanine ligase [Actinobacteria bacterium]|nr:D-alanine--D-alanine ligase [Actinomycetota bacterium]
MSSARSVLLIAGGRSSERTVSLSSGEAVRTGLLDGGHDVTAVEIAADGRWYRVEDFAAREDDEPLPGEPIALTPGGGALGAEVVFPMLHGPFGEDGAIQGFLETIGVPYVGSGIAASAVCLDKLLFKEVAGRAGVPQVEYVAIEAESWRSDEDLRDRMLEEAVALGFPSFVKPARLGSSVGISRVAQASELEAAIQNALRYDPRVIVEAGAPGDEIECAVLGNRELDVSQPGKLEFTGDWYDFAAKYEHGGMRLIAPAPISESLEIELCSMAARAFRVAGCAGMARVDFFVDGASILVNEINTIPGFTPTSVYAKLFEASGLAYGDLLDRLLDLAVERFEHERGFRF